MKNPEGVERHGLKKCSACRKQFTVRHNTIFAESHIPLRKRLRAIYLMASNKKGISSHLHHRVLEIPCKSAWFLSHRSGEAMRSDNTFDFGSGRGVVEVEETFIDHKHKKAMLALVDHRTSG